MATADEILEQMKNNPELYAADPEEICVIDNDLRTITVPSGIQTVGVESDEDVRRLHFQMPKQYHEVDLSEFDIRINFMNANNQGDVYAVTDKQVTGDNITFSWLVGRNALAYRGSIRFIVCLKKTDAEGVVQQEFNTTVAQLTVLEGLETTEAVVAENPDIIEQILARLDDLEENGGDGGTPGKDGVGIDRIEKTSTQGLVDTYTIYLTDESTYTFTVTNGKDGNPGAKGDPGEDGITPTIGENGNWYLGDEDTGKPSRGSDVSLAYSQIEKISKKIFSGEIKKIILIGDSITDGYGGTGYNGNRTYGYLNTAGYCWANILKKYLSDRFQIETDNYGKYNSKIDEQFQIIQSNIISGNYDLCVWLSGTNNRVDSSTFQTYKTVLPQAINYLKDNIDDFVIISAIPATKDDEAGRGHKGYEIDEVALSSCVAENCCFSSGYRKFCDYIELTDTDITSCFSDHVHPNDLGYYILFKIICNILNIPLDPYTNYKIDGGYWNTEDPGGSEDDDNVIIDTYNKGGQPFVSWGDGVIPVILTAGYNADNHSTIYSGKTIKTIKFNLGESGNSGTITIGKLDLTLPRSQADINITEEMQYTIDSDGLVDLGDGITLGSTETLTIGREADTARLIYYTNATSDDNIMTCRLYAAESGQIINSRTGIPIIVTI